jgi:hypothetical protein
MDENLERVEGTQKNPEAGATSTDQQTSPQEHRQAVGQEKPAKTYTQAEFDAHMAAFRRKMEEEVRRAAERAKMDEAERLKAEKADLEVKLAEIERSRLQAEAKSALLQAGADPQRIEAALRIYLAEREGNPDLAPEQFLESWPEMRAKPKPAVSGAALGGNKAPRPSTLSEAIAQHYRR